MLEPKTSSARGPSSVPSASSSSYAERPLPGSDVRRHAPHSGDVLARRRVVDHPVARQLVGLLPVLAAALPVALPGQAAVAGVRRPALPERERHVDPREHGVGALGVLLGAARGQHHHLVRARRAAGPARAPRRRHAGDPLDPLRPPGGDRPAYRRRSRWCARRRTPCRRRRPRPARCSTPERQREVGARAPAARTRRRGRRSASAAGRPRRRCRRGRAARRGGARRAASSRRGSSRPAPARRSARRRRAGTAGRGPRRTRGCRPTPPTTCTSGRCSRSGWCRARPGRTCRAGRPSRWSARRRRRRRRRPARCSSRIAVSRARDQVERLVPVDGPELAGRAVPHAAAWSAAPGARAGRPRSSPCGTAPPWLTGNSAHAATSGERAPDQPHPALQRAVRAVRPDAALATVIEVRSGASARPATLADRRLAHVDSTR